MPKHFKNKRYKRKIPKKYPHTKVNFSPSTMVGPADTLRVRLPYNERSTFASAAAPGNYVFRGNSIAGPNFTVAGHKPMFFKELQALYDRYYVIASSIEVDCSAIGSHIQLCLYPSNTSSSILVMDQAVEQPRALQVWKSTGGQAVKLKNRMTSKAARGAGIAKDDGQSALMTSNPDRQWFWHLVGHHIDQISATTFYFNVRIVYDVVLYRKLQGTLSP